jgi:hypothetical protein
MDFPTVEWTARERSAGRPDPATLDRIWELFTTWGTVRLVNLFEPAFMDRVVAHYRARYGVHLAGTTKKDLRPLFSPKLVGPFATDTYHSNPLLFPVVQRALGDDCVLGAFGSVVSFPGSPAQFRHRDSGSLFDDYSIDVQLPPYALTVLIPLIDANAETGATRVWPGSHREPDFDKAQAMPSESPDLPRGSVLMTDSRTVHGGSPNVSNRVRPIVYNSYHRSWYRDEGGYEHRPPVHLGALGQLTMPRALRGRFRIPRETSTIDRVGWELKKIFSRKETR